MLANDATDSNDPNVTAAADIIEQNALAAEGEFESYVSQRYSIPLQWTDGTVPELVKNVIYSLAKYRLFARRNALKPDVVSEYENAILWLNRVAMGKVNIVLLDSADDVQSTGSTPIVSAPGDFPNSQFNRIA